MKQKFAVLNSGFISNNTEMLTLNPVNNHKFFELLLNKSHLNTQSSFFYNKDIVDLFNDWLGNKKITSDLEFQERTIILAYKLFNNSSIYSWMMNQTEVLNKTINELHIKFLNETVDFITTGKRQLEVLQWARLLVVTTDVFNYKDENIRSFVKDIDIIKYGDLTSKIALWLSQKNGFEDMLITLYIIFGDRVFITEIVDV